MWVLCVLKQPNLLPIYRCHIVIFPHSTLSSPQYLPFSPSLSLSPSLSCFYYVSVFTSHQMKLVFEHGLHTHISLVCFTSECKSVCVCACVHVDSLEESQKARQTLLCYLLYKHNMIVRHVPLCLLLSLSPSLELYLSRAWMSVSRFLLLQVLIINECDIKKPKNQFLLRFFDSLRAAFVSFSIATFVTHFKTFFLSIILQFHIKNFHCSKNLQITKG